MLKYLKNLFLICYKFVGKDCVTLVNPTPQQVGELFKFKLVGFQCSKNMITIMYGVYWLLMNNYTTYQKS